MGSATKAEKKEKKRKQSEDAADIVVAEEPKAKKRKRDREPAEGAPIDPAPLEAPDEPSLEDTKRKKKKDKKRKELAIAASVEDEQPADTPKRKSKKRDAASAVEAERRATDDAGDLEDISPVKPKKKRKDQTTNEENLAGGKPAKVSKKYPDPAKDDTLNEQSQKGLAYAHAYATSSDWKFNKARQNWLMKHVYDSAMVPDEYLRMVFHYLKSIKGQALEHLRKTCQTIMDSPMAQEPPDAAAPTAGGAEEAKCRTDRASALLKKLPGPAAVAVAEE